MHERGGPAPTEITSQQTQQELAHVCAVLAAYRYRFANEAQLHEGIARALAAAGIVFKHELIASRDCRFDFYLPDIQLVLEVKIAGSLPAALQQVDRYAQRPDCRGVILAATKTWARGGLKQELRGKPVWVHHLAAQAF